MSLRVNLSKENRPPVFGRRRYQKGVVPAKPWRKGKVQLGHWGRAVKWLLDGSGAPPSIRWNLAPETCGFNIKFRLVAMRRSTSPSGACVGEGQAHRGRSPSSSTR